MATYVVIDEQDNEYPFKYRWQSSNGSPRAQDLYDTLVMQGQTPAMGYWDKGIWNLVLPKTKKS